MTEKGSGTLLQIAHRAMGDISPEHRSGVSPGWEHIANRIKARASK